MVVVILGRELLVTSIRGLAEKSGIAFGADQWGKIKMVLQSITILVIITYVYFHEIFRQHFPDVLSSYDRWAGTFRDGMIWVMLVATVASAWGYLRRSTGLMQSDDR
ncbi:MAG: hypothetical protein KatS3mg104_2873 [Phycisphaerae bacterium]|nr:MAG: hypothetical protein KatS3mg104_2873 [Phycisphaerae bacterium]